MDVGGDLVVNGSDRAVTEGHIQAAAVCTAKTAIVHGARPVLHRRQIAAARIVVAKTIKHSLVITVAFTRHIIVGIQVLLADKVRIARAVANLRYGDFTALETDAGHL